MLPHSGFLPTVGDTFLRPPSRVSRWLAGAGLYRGVSNKANAAAGDLEELATSAEESGSAFAPSARLKGLKEVLNLAFSPPHLPLLL